VLLPMPISMNGPKGPEARSTYLRSLTGLLWVASLSPQAVRRRVSPSASRCRALVMLIPLLVLQPSLIPGAMSRSSVLLAPGELRVALANKGYYNSCNS